MADRPFVRLSRAMGASAPRVIALHILPNIIRPLPVVATLEFGLMALFLLVLSANLIGDRLGDRIGKG